VLADANLQDQPTRAFRKGAGCAQCHDSGCKGRVGVYEVLEVTPPIRRLVHRAAASHEIRDEARKQGLLTLREEGVLIALAGKSSLEEVLSVTHDEGDHEEDAKPPKREVA
jgi:type II secretory ATPase GspE/PulE/Tfp pilus assembly ATPase PilB-like protein